MVQQLNIIDMRPQNCEVCGRRTPENGPCTTCQEWVEHYTYTLPRNSFGCEHGPEPKLRTFAFTSL